MNGRILVCLLAAGALTLTGCITASNTAPVDEQNVAVPGLLPETEALWADPQNMPHPAFNYPTLVNPAEGEDVPAYWRPIPAGAMPATIAGLKHETPTDGVASGAGIALFGSLAVVPGYSEESYVVDITNPTAPKVLGTFAPAKSAHRGAVIIAYPNGTLVTALSTGQGFEVFDITDPTTPTLITTVEPPTGGHKIGVVPGTPIIYNANSAGGNSNGLVGVDALDPATAAGQTEIYDLTNPWAPVLVQEFKNGYGCHHIFFWNNPAENKYRAICAGIEYTQIWDTADPLNPVVIVNVPVHHGNPAAPTTSVPITAFSHFSILSADGRTLIVGDEMGGGSVPPGCTAPGAPTGAVWFYDVSTETSPKLLGWFSPGTHLPKNDPTASCTAHHGRLVPGPNGEQLLAVAFYGSGVVLIDFSDPAMPKMVDQFNEGTQTWEVWYYNGYLFTGDLNRGMDVLSFE